jgi:Anti-sigma-K factor rskA
MRLKRRNARDPEPLELAALADGSLAPDRSALLEARVATSPELAERLAEQHRAVAIARSAAVGVEAPASLRARIEAQRTAARAPARRRPVAIVAGAAAAAAVAALAVTLVMESSRSSGERFTAALAGTGLAPTAEGDATLTKTPSGWRIELEATGLSRLAGRRFYEAWLRNPAGVLVPIGTFNDGRKVTLWAGVSPLRFTTFSVTREQADGDQSSSGEKVLVGAITGTH